MPPKKLHNEASFEMSLIVQMFCGEPKRMFISKQIWRLQCIGS